MDFLFSHGQLLQLLFPLGWLLFLQQLWLLSCVAFDGSRMGFDGWGMDGSIGDSWEFEVGIVEVGLGVLVEF